MRVVGSSIEVNCVPMKAIGPSICRLLPGSKVTEVNPSLQKAHRWISCTLAGMIIAVAKQTANLLVASSDSGNESVTHLAARSGRSLTAKIVAIFERVNEDSDNIRANRDRGQVRIVAEAMATDICDASLNYDSRQAFVAEHLVAHLSPR